MEDLAQFTIDDSKEQLAGFASAIQQTPEKSIDSVEKIHEFCSHPDSTIAKLALLTEVVVFKDIIPGYQIHSHTDEDERQLSQGVQILHNFERKLLRNYQKFLKFLERCLKIASLRPTAAEALCALMVTHPHFNFFGNIVGAVVPLLLDPLLCPVVCGSFKELFLNDPAQEATLEVVEKVATLIARHPKRIPPLAGCPSSRPPLTVSSSSGPVAGQVVETLSGWVRVDLPSSSQLHDERGEERMVELEQRRFEEINRRHEVRLDKKALEEERRFHRDLAQTKLTRDIAQRQRVGTALLRALVRAFTAVLDIPSSPLLVPALGGLSRLAAHLNIELISDLVMHVRALLSEQLLIRQRLEADQQAGRPQGPEGAAPGGEDGAVAMPLLPFATAVSLIDPHTLYCALYSRLPEWPQAHRQALAMPRTPRLRAADERAGPHKRRRVAGAEGEEDEEDERGPIDWAALEQLAAQAHERAAALDLTVVRCLDTITRRAKTLSVARAAGLAKQLLGVALHLPPAGACAALAAFRLLLQQIPGARALVSSESPPSCIVYRPDSADPDRCGALGSCAWDLHLLASVTWSFVFVAAGPLWLLGWRGGWRGQRHEHPLVAASARQALGLKTLPFTQTPSVVYREVARHAAADEPLPEPAAPRSRASGRKRAAPDSLLAAAAAEEAEEAARDGEAVREQEELAREQETLGQNQREAERELALLEAQAAVDQPDQDPQGTATGPPRGGRGGRGGEAGEAVGAGEAGEAEEGAGAAGAGSPSEAIGACLLARWRIPSPSRAAGAAD
ncbi:putative nucleolar complex-associated protein 3 [Paratrimastix pyriformis]|uniref:Nucleolar complex-associated protein 3 n=1 Tax=Paratrimastix pyriformis TaxID=342808 RepID=A0ABQ8UT17_9EUKA|nr:putative nucleolar complex-associated protein 3 [Paratrimastix pyriformis]